MFRVFCDWLIEERIIASRSGFSDLGFVFAPSSIFSVVRVFIWLVMGEEGSAVALGDGFPPDDLDVAFEFEDDDEDLTIDFETIYRILDEKPPDSSQV